MEIVLLGVLQGKTLLFSEWSKAPARKKLSGRAGLISPRIGIDHNGDTDIDRDLRRRRNRAQVFVVGRGNSAVSSYVDALVIEGRKVGLIEHDASTAKLSWPHN